MGIFTKDKWTPKPPEKAPPGFKAEEFFAGQHWHQRWEVYKDVFTPGRNPVGLLCEYLGLPQDLRGKRVLDIGAWHGCFSFECERRGASEVVAMILEDPDSVGFTRLKKALNSKVQVVNQSVYTIDQKVLGQFDVVLFSGVLYHLRYPLLAIDKIRTVCRGTCYTETHVIDNNFLVPGPEGQMSLPLSVINPELTKLPIWRFYKEDELLQNWSNWFGPNTQAVVEGFESAGFTCKVQHQWGDRATFAATVELDLLRSFDRTYEGTSADNQQFIGITIPADYVARE